MKKEIADKWVAALRSGEYKQATGALDKGVKGQCCLGVLCLILGKEGTQVKRNGKDLLAYEGEMDILPDSVVEETGMNSKEGYYHGKYLMLAEQNDNGLTFEQIADIIERHYEEL